MALQTVFEYQDVKASDRLEALAQEKLNSLQDKFEFLQRADIFFKTENTSSKDSGMKCGIRLSVPGPRLFAESSEKDFATAIGVTLTELEAQLRRKKEKMKNHRDV